MTELERLIEIEKQARKAYESLSLLLNDDDGAGREVTSAVGDWLDSIRANLQDALDLEAV
jgi:hypothetical protein